MGVATCEVVILVLAVLVLSCTEAGVTGALLVHTFSVCVTIAVCFAAVGWITSDEANCVTVTFGIVV